MSEQKENLWVRLKRALRRIKVPPMSGDGGIHSDKGITVKKPQVDSSVVIQDTTVVRK